MCKTQNDSFFVNLERPGATHQRLLCVFSFLEMNVVPLPSVKVIVECINVGARGH